MPTAIRASRKPWDWANLISRAEYDKCEELREWLDSLPVGRAAYDEWWGRVRRDVGWIVYAHYLVVRQRMRGQPLSIPKTDEERDIDDEAVDAARREFRDSVGPLCKGD